MRHFNDTLYISDLDGTLLDPQSRVSAETLDILNPLIDKGLMFTVATARTPATVENLLEGLKISATPGGRDVPAIVMTGAAYWNRHLRRYDYLRLCSWRDTDIIIKELRREGITPFQYWLGDNEMLNVYHDSNLSTKEDEFYQERRHLKLKKFHIGMTPDPDKPTVLFFAMGDPEKLDKVCKRINKRTDCSAAWYRDIFNPNNGLMDIYAPGCSKATAIKDIACELGIRRTVVFGDNLNDIPMMQAADLAVAVENALPAVKEIADVVIGSNHGPSVAEFIRKDNEEQLSL